MGYIRHHAIVVTASYSTGIAGGPDEHWIERAHHRAVDIFDGTCAKVTEPTPDGMNSTRSFLVAPDGSKEGWADSDDGNEARDRFIAWLEAQAYGDGSNPLAWVEVQFGDDDLETRVTRDSDEAQRAEV